MVNEDKPKSESFIVRRGTIICRYAAHPNGESTTYWAIPTYSGARQITREEFEETRRTAQRNGYNPI